MLKSARLFILALSMLAFPLASYAADVYAVHGIPGTDLGLELALPVDVAVGGDCVVPDLQFGDIAGPLALDPGVYLFEIFLADAANPCSGDLVISTEQPVNLVDSLAVVAHLTDQGAIRATPFLNDFRPTAEGEARLTIRHGADAPAVDVYARANGVPSTPVASGLVNGLQQTTSVPADTWQAGIVPAGTFDIVAGPVALELAAGTSNVVYAVGSLASGTFELLVQTVPTR